MPYIQLLKHIQYLPTRTANSAVLILAGLLPLESELHKSMLSVFRNIVGNKESMEYKIVFRQLALKSKSLDGWFIQIVKLSDQYGFISSPLDIITTTPENIIWKKIVNQVVRERPFNLKRGVMFFF